MDTMYTVHVSLTPYILVLEAALALCIIALVAWALQDSDQDSWPVRGFHISRLAGTRMSKMLRVRQIDVGSYLQSVPVVELKRQIGACQSCGQHAACDRALAGAGADFGFCPNRRAIEQLLAKGARAA